MDRYQTHVITCEQLFMVMKLGIISWDRPQRWFCFLCTMCVYIYIYILTISHICWLNHQIISIILCTIYIYIHIHTHRPCYPSLHWWHSCRTMFQGLMSLWFHSPFCLEKKHQTPARSPTYFGNGAEREPTPHQVRRRNGDFQWGVPHAGWFLRKIPSRNMDDHL